jgi:cell pole-organizing protein PopZ
MRQEGEPSVDQILQSIKKVLARDAERASATREGIAPPAPAAALAPDPVEPADEEEAADLRDAAEPAGAGWPQPDALPEEPRLAEAELIEPADELIEDEADGEAEPAVLADGPHTPADADVAAPLTSEATAASIRNALAALAMLAEPGAPLPGSEEGSAALNARVREVLRPMLSQWLEANLPAIVEREVRAEIARITGVVSS